MLNDWINHLLPYIVDVGVSIGELVQLMVWIMAAYGGIFLLVCGPSLLLCGLVLGLGRLLGLKGH